MQFRLRTLLIVLAVGIPIVWLACQFAPGANLVRSLSGVGVFAAVMIATWISFWPEQQFRREFSQRQLLDDGRFFDEFYAHTNVPAEIVRRLRPIYCKFFDLEVGKLRPQDRPPEIADLDMIDLVQAIETEFGVTISDNDAEHINGSFDSIARYLAERSQKAQCEI
jgi:acyl carrier protein